MGYYFLFEVNKLLVKKEMKAMIRKNTPKVTILHVIDPETNHDLYRVDKREIIFKGNLYDIIKESKNGRTTTFYCIFDYKEQNLIAGFKRICHNKFNQTLLDHLIKIALPVFYMNCDIPYCNEIAYANLKTFTRSTFQSPLTPPPEVC